MARAKPIPNELTAEQHALFDSLVKVWQKRLGLTGWRIERSKKKTKEMAQVEIFYGAKLATYRVGDFGSTDVTPESIEETVVHELEHILLYPLVYQVELELSDEVVLAEEHSVINTLTRHLIKPAPAAPTPARTA